MIHGSFTHVLTAQGPLVVPQDVDALLGALRHFFLDSDSGSLPVASSSGALSEACRDAQPASAGERRDAVAEASAAQAEPLGTCDSAQDLSDTCQCAPAAAALETAASPFRSEARVRVTGYQADAPLRCDADASVAPSAGGDLLPPHRASKSRPAVSAVLLYPVKGCGAFRPDGPWPVTREGAFLTSPAHYQHAHHIEAGVVTAGAALSW